MEFGRIETFILTEPPGIMELNINLNDLIVNNKKIIMTNELQLLDEANREIKRLRQRNFIMQSRLDVFDAMLQVFNCQPPNNSVAMSPDITYEIDKLLEAKKVE